MKTRKKNFKWKSLHKKGQTINDEWKILNEILKSCTSSLILHLYSILLIHPLLGQPPSRHLLQYVPISCIACPTNRVTSSDHLTALLSIISWMILHWLEKGSRLLLPFSSIGPFIIPSYCDCTRDSTKPI